MAKSLSDITVASVDGRAGGDYSGAILSIQKSVSELPGTRGLLLTPTRPSSIPPEIEHQQIPQLNYQEYSFFVTYLLHEYIQTDFCLLVQEDGWVLNGKAWNNKFFDFDYIGPPIHLAEVVHFNRTTFVKGFEWINYLRDEESVVTPVMNGGFSLRSLRMLRTPSLHKIPYVITPPTLIRNKNTKMIWPTDSQNEDVQLCLCMRPTLERLGIKFADLGIAKRFGVEHLAPDLWDSVNLETEILGTHSSLRKLVSLNPAAVKYVIPRRSTLKIFREDRVLEVFSKLGYTVYFSSPET